MRMNCLSNCLKSELFWKGEQNGRKAVRMHLFIVHLSVIEMGRDLHSSTYCIDFPFPMNFLL